MTRRELPVSARTCDARANHGIGGIPNFQVADQGEGRIFVAAVRLKLSARDLACGTEAGRMVPLPHEPKRFPKLTALDSAPDQIGLDHLSIPAAGQIPFRALQRSAQSVG
jgi:hypothetical protein